MIILLHGGIDLLTIDLLTVFTPLLDYVH